MRLKYRPLALTGFTVLLVLFLSVFADSRAAAAAVAAGAVLAVCSFFIKPVREKVYPFFLAAALILGGLLFTVENDYGLEYAEKFTENESSSVEGIITDFPEYSDSRYYYSIETVSVDSKPIKVNLRLSLPYELDAEPYDRISADVKLYMIGRASGDGIERFYNSKEIFLGAYCTDSEDESTAVIENNYKKPLRYRIILLRKELEERILEKLPNEYGGTAAALLVGDKSFISEETKDNIYDAGVAPVFAVSGLHLSVWVLGLYEFLKQLKVNRRINSAVNIAFTLFFMALTGFSPSVCRSGLMMILFLAGNLFYRRTDSVNSLGFSALVLCILNPFIAADTGFLMSFTATLGIVAVLPFAERLSGKYIRFGWLRAVISAVLVSIAAVVGSFPVVVFSVGYISVFTVVSNLLITYAATLCMFFAGITAVLYGITALSDMTAFLCGILSKYILAVVGKISDFHVTCISTSDIFWKAGVIISLAVIASALMFFKGKASRRFGCIGLVCVIAVTALSSTFYYDGLTEFRLINVGDGTAAAVSYEGKKILLKGADDGYNSLYSIEDTLNRISRRDANMLLISDADSAECGSTLHLLKDNNFIKTVIPLESPTVSQLVESSRLIVSADADLNVWENGKINFYCDESVSCAFCEFDTKTFLVIFSAVSGSEIPDEYTSADFLICSGYIPECIDVSAFRAVFVSSTPKKSASVSGYITKNGGRPVKVCDYDEISVRIRNGKYKIYV